MTRIVPTSPGPVWPARVRFLAAVTVVAAIALLSIPSTAVWSGAAYPSGPTAGGTARPTVHPLAGPAFPDPAIRPLTVRLTANPSQVDVGETTGISALASGGVP